MAKLSLERQQEIDTIIDDLRLETGLSYPQDDVLDFTEALNIPVYFVDTDAIEKNLSGAINYREKGRKSSAEIFVNYKTNKNRQLFTVAHELGHYLLHGTEIQFRQDGVDYSNMNSKELIEETEANYFAASFLMPKDDFLAKVNEGLSDFELADFFGVSEAAVSIRKKWLHEN